MKKGNLGIVLSFYAIVAFVLAALGQTLLCAVLLGFVLIVEKDEWTSKQVMQGFFLALFSSVVKGVFNFLAFTDFAHIDLPALIKVEDVTNYIVFVLVVICAIVGIVNTAKGMDAKIPLLSSLAERAYGHMPVINNNMGGYNAPNPQQNYQQSPYDNYNQNQNQNNNAPRV